MRAGREPAGLCFAQRSVGTALDSVVIWEEEGELVAAGGKEHVAELLGERAIDGVCDSANAGELGTGLHELRAEGSGTFSCRNRHLGRRSSNKE